jgi:two-component system CheB/CheR fusion protein
MRRAEPAWATPHRPAYEELQSTNEELETTNEELQSTNEELETTNEELQSANEELETMNEELQSTNAELQATSDQLEQRAQDLADTTAFLNSLVESLEAAVVVLGRDLSVQLWSDKAYELWGLKPEEAIGQSFFELDIGLPVDELREPVAAALAGAEERSEAVVDAVNRRGKAFRCQVSCRTPASAATGPRGVVLLFEVLPGDR